MGFSSNVGPMDVSKITRGSTYEPVLEIPHTIGDSIALRLWHLASVDGVVL